MRGGFVKFAALPRDGVGRLLMSAVVFAVGPRWPLTRCRGGEDPEAPHRVRGVHWMIVYARALIATATLRTLSAALPGT